MKFHLNINCSFFFGRRQPPYQTTNLSNSLKLNIDLRLSLNIKERAARLKLLFAARNNNRVYTRVSRQDCVGDNTSRHLKVTLLKFSSVSEDKYLGKVEEPRPGDKIGQVKEEGAERENQAAG